MERLHFTVQEADHDQRLDMVLSQNKTRLSRSQVQHAIKEGRVWVNQVIRKASHKIHAGDTIEIEIPDPIPLEAQSENIPIEILFEDPWVIVVNKPAGLVVHPACGNYTGTLVNALLHHCKTLSGIGGVIRPGIVHRLDKGTSGVLVVAKNDLAHQSLSRQFKQHTVVRRYSALVFGIMYKESGTISSPIGRHYTDRKKMSTKTKKGRDAVTHWKVQEVFDALTLLEASLETGRTHQVRVHLSSIGHPIVGDHTYGASQKLKSISSKSMLDIVKGVDRPLLHAGYLEFIHPHTKMAMSFSSPLPDDFSHVVNRLRG